MTKRVLWRAIIPQPHVGLSKPGYAGDAGIDLTVAFHTILHATSRAPTMVPIGIQIALPDDVAALVVGRSSMLREGIMVVTTLIDPGFRGDIFVLAYPMNTDLGRRTIEAGTRIAQLVPIPCLGSGLILKEVHGPLPESDRGSRGWGSTGE